VKAIACQPHENIFREHFTLVDANNPFLLSGILVLEGDVVKGALCLYDNPEILVQGLPVLMLGNFSCINDPRVAEQLFIQATTIARQTGKSFLVGPMNGSIWHDYRLPISGNSPLFSGDMTQPLFHADLFCANGFQVIHRYHAYTSGIPDTSHENISLPEGISLRPANIGNLEAELSGLYTLCLKAFRDIPLFTPVSKEFFIHKYTQMLPLFHEQLTLIAIQNDLPVAFLFTYQDTQDPQTLIIKTAAKHPDYHLPGLMTNMARTLLKQSSGMGHTKAIHAFMHEENRSLLRSREFGGSILRSYALLGKNISN
jgi:hypothetical protein